MRAHPETPFEIGRLTDLCEEAELGAFLVAAAAGERPRQD